MYTKLTRGINSKDFRDFSRVVRKRIKKYFKLLFDVSFLFTAEGPHKYRLNFSKKLVLIVFTGVGGLYLHDFI